MPALSAIDVELQSLTKFKKSQLALLANGVRIRAATNIEIDDLVRTATCDRYKLARLFLNSASTLSSLSPAKHRDAISHAYYSMYHCARAVVYIVEVGDDHQEHDQLYKFLPNDFPDRDDWQNELKEARLRRNEADYDPYPKGIGSFRRVSNLLVATARDFHQVCGTYLVSKGCTL